MPTAFRALKPSAHRRNKLHATPDKVFSANLGSAGGWRGSVREDRVGDRVAGGLSCAGGGGGGGGGGLKGGGGAPPPFPHNPGEGSPRGVGAPGGRPG